MLDLRFIRLFRKIDHPDPLDTGEVFFMVNLVFKIVSPLEVIAEITEKAPCPGKMEFRRLITDQKFKEAEAGL
jgi:hypothetical protein